MPSHENGSAEYIPRPPNAFICFRSRLFQDQKTLLASAQGESKPGMKDISRWAGQIWNEMSEQDKLPYVEMAARMKEEHKMAHPDYKFTPASKKAKNAPALAPRRRPQATGSRRRREHEPSPPPMPTPSFSYTPPPTHGQLQLPADMSGNEPSETSHYRFERPDTYQHPAQFGTSGQKSHYRSERPDAYRNPAQFGTPDAVSTPQQLSSYYPVTSTPSPQERVYHSFEQTEQLFEPQQDFGSFCQWDHDFSRVNGASSSRSYRPY